MHDNNNNIILIIIQIVRVIWNPHYENRHHIPLPYLYQHRYQCNSNSHIYRIRIRICISIRIRINIRIRTIYIYISTDINALRILASVSVSVFGSIPLLSLLTVIEKILFLLQVESVAVGNHDHDAEYHHNNYTLFVIRDTVAIVATLRYCFTTNTVLADCHCPRFSNKMLSD